MRDSDSTTPGESQFAAYQPRRPGQSRMALPQDLRVRPARLEDADELAAILAEREGGMVTHHRERVQKELTNAALRSENLLLVAEAEDQIVGFGRTRYFRPAPDAPANIAPEGWYLAGVIVAPRFRRRGIGAELTRQRLEWIAERAKEAFYFANVRNTVSISLHTQFGFVELTRDFVFPGATFAGGIGVLYRIDLAGG